MKFRISLSAAFSAWFIKLEFGLSKQKSDLVE